MNVGGEDALFGFGGEAIFTAIGGDQGRVFAARVALGIVAEVVVEVPIEQVLVGTQQEGPGPTGGVHHPQAQGLDRGNRRLLLQLIKRPTP